VPLNPKNGGDVEGGKRSRRVSTINLATDETAHVSALNRTKLMSVLGGGLNLSTQHFIL